MTQFVTLRRIFLGRHSLMAGLRIPIQFFGEKKKKPLTPVFEEFSYVFFHLHHFQKGVTRGH